MNNLYIDGIGKVAPQIMGKGPEKHFRWDRLRSIGNSRIAKLAILVPIFGYLIIFNQHLVAYYNTIFDPDLNTSFWLYFFYFGMSSIGFGSLIYIFWCPKEIQEYGSSTRRMR